MPTTQADAKVQGRIYGPSSLFRHSIEDPSFHNFQAYDRNLTGSWSDPRCASRISGQISAAVDAASGNCARQQPPTVFITAFPADALRAQVMAKGALALLEKPVDVVVLGII